MSTARKSFDRLATVYLALERLAFGRDLERARFRHLAELRDCQRILVFGEGDGRCLQRLVRIARHAQIDCIDVSRAMIDRARQRLSADDAIRVTFRCADARTVQPPPGIYDGVATFFFLDCFTDAEAVAIVQNIRQSLHGAAIWLFADFTAPASGWRRFRARAWLKLLYTFFRWQTDLTARALPHSEKHIEAAGFWPARRVKLQHGLLTTTMYRRTETN